MGIINNIIMLSLVGVEWEFILSGGRDNLDEDGDRRVMERLVGMIVIFPHIP